MFIFILSILNCWNLDYGIGLLYLFCIYFMFIFILSILSCYNLDYDTLFNLIFFNF